MVSMKEGDRLSLERIRAFLEGVEEFEFAVSNQANTYAWTERTLREQRYQEAEEIRKDL
jgi:hypothetical protein